MFLSLWSCIGRTLLPSPISLVVLLLLPTLSIAQSITSIQPATICQGETVTITGSGFTGATGVKLGNLQAASFTVQNDGSIVARVADAAGGGTVSVTTPDGIANGPVLSVLAAPKPELADISTVDAPFANCNGNATYTLIVRNNSSVTGTGNAYDINWGDNTAHFTQTDWASGAQTSHTYTSQGYYVITITITPPNGCKKSMTYRFYNGQNPLASFTTTTSTTGLCAPAAIEFQVGNWFNNSAGTSYILNWGDGTPEVTLQHPLDAANVIRRVSHIYNNSSCPNIDYTATLKASNGCFVTTYTLNQIIIRKKPAADFTTQPNQPCVNSQVCFTNQTINGYGGNNTCLTNTVYEWDFGDNSPKSNQQSPCHTYAAAGTYTVTLKASNTSCGEDTKVKQITVLPNSPFPIVASPVNYCQGRPATVLTATGSNLLWYTTATGGTGSTTTPVPSTTTPGTRTWYVSQTLPNSCESGRVPVTVTVSALPAAPAVVSPVQLCQGQTASSLTATGSNLLWYDVASGGMGSSTAPIPATATAGSITYYVSQTVNGCEGPRAAITVTVNAPAGVPTVNSPVVYCQHQTAAPLTAIGSSLRWYTSATGGTGVSTAPIPSTATPGSTTWYVSQVTGCGESPRVSITVQVDASPMATIAYAPAILCNAGSSMPISVTQTGETGGVFSVVPATGLSVDAATGKINPAGATPGTYTIRYTVAGSGSCGNAVFTTAVTVNAAPSASIAYPAICSSTAAVPVVRTGTTGGTFISSSGLTIHSVTGTITPMTSTPGTYTVDYVIAAAGPCPGFSTSTQVTITQAPSATISYAPSTLCNIAPAPSTPNPPVPVVQTGEAGGIYTITPANGLTIDPTTGTIDPAGATPGTYTVRYTVAGSGGCSNFSTAATVIISGVPTATISYPGSPYCSGLSVLQPVVLTGSAGGLFTADAGLSVNASTGAIDPAASTPGTYTVTYTVSPSAPCPGYIATATVAISESPVITFPVAAQSICSGGTATYTPSSSVVNTVYNWSIVGGLPPGVNGVSSGTASGSSAAISLSFTNSGAVNQSIVVQVTPANPSSNPCPGVPYRLALVVHPIPPAPLTETIDLCMKTPPVTLHQAPLPNMTIKWYDQQLQLLSGAPVIPTDHPRQFTYFVSHTNQYGCEGPQGAKTAVVHPTAKIVGTEYHHPVACGIPSGSIVLHVLDLNNDPMPNRAVLVHYTKFQIALTTPLTTDATGKITIPLTAGTYSNILVETSGGCISQPIPDVFVLKDPNPPAQPVAGYNPPICSAQPLTLTASTATSGQNGHIDYVWAGPAFGPYADTSKNTVVTFPSASTSDAGTYVVYAVQNNCISLPVSFQVEIRQSPSKPVINTRLPLCVGDALFLHASSSMPGNSGMTYLWKGPGAGFPVNTANAGISKVKVDDAGIYSITVTALATGCSASTDTLIQIGDYPVVRFAEDTVTLPTGYRYPLKSALINAGAPGVLPMKQYAWTPADDLSCNDVLCSEPILTVKKDGCYTLTATNVYGCIGRDEICFKVFCQSSQVFLPNAFTPRGNVVENTRLTVRASGVATVKTFRVFNRWGRVVFERSNFAPNNPAYGWDGMANGRLADTGVYIYTIDVICENGVPYTFKGNVTLL